jgi:hypothetical protein
VVGLACITSLSGLGVRNAAGEGDRPGGHDDRR